MKDARNTPIKIRRMSIRNYKGIDELEIEFPAPSVRGNPDIIVMGSRNGLGKTSVIESGSLLLYALFLNEEQFRFSQNYAAIDIPDLIVRAGQDVTGIEGDIEVGGRIINVNLKINRNGHVEIRRKNKINGLRPSQEGDLKNFIKMICGFTPNPIAEDGFILFHSYRKVQEGNPGLGLLVERERSLRRGLPLFRYEQPISALKLRMLRAMMSEADLFDIGGDLESGESVNKLNDIMRVYAGGEIRKLRPSSENTVDFRVKPTGTNGNETFTFDGLSSGQKEVVSTLFLIWDHTRSKPSVVFIDEPELHLNAGWHQSFVKELVKIAPQNQYILATHSEDIMNSVDEGRRILLLNNQEGDA